MFVCILGRQPEISIAELRSVHGNENATQVAPGIATVDSSQFDLTVLGGTTKYGQIIETVPIEDHRDKPAFLSASRKIIQHYSKAWKNIDHKITLGISTYNFNISPRDVQKTGLIIKSSLKKDGVSLRLVPNSESTLSTAVSHNNKLGLSPSKVELLIIKTTKGVVIAESRGSQNITAYAKRDRDRPRRDAFVGMLPPKLAQIMINLAVGPRAARNRLQLLDPFCGTGTVLQEAILRGYTSYGTDLNPKMIDYSRDNLQWLVNSHRTSEAEFYLEAGDAMTHNWPYAKQIDAVVCETYLGQPFSAPPSPEKLRQVVKNCDHIVTEFLKNIRRQVTEDTILCLAVPAWQDTSGRFTHLPIAGQLRSVGFKNITGTDLLYHRTDQVVGRKILVLKPTSS